MIYYVGNKIPNSDLFFTSTSFEEFDKWISQLHIYQIDTETNVTNSIVERKLKLIQFGDSRGKEQWVIQPTALTQSQAIRLVEILNNPLPIKIAHNISFEYQILKKYGVILSNLYDTMLAEKIIWCGYSVEPGFYALSGLYKRYLFKELDKELQTSFDVDNFSVEQIFYAAQDVTSLGGIRRMQIDSLRQANLLNVMALENEAVCAFAEIEYTGCTLDLVKWRDNIALADPIIEEAQNKLNTILKSEELRDKVIALGYLSDEDKLNINWNSTLDKKTVFNKVYPTLTGITKPIITKYLKSDLQGEDDIESRLALFAYLEKDYNTLNSYLLEFHYDFLVEQELVIPKNTVTISWTSPKEKLDIFRLIAPNIKSVGEPVLSEYEHPLIDAYFEWLNANTLKTKYGEKFIDKHVESDGKVRTHFNQIVNTGRSSSSNYNQQNIPAKGRIGARYRNCFIADDGWLVCSSDFASQELTLIAVFSGEKAWLDSLKYGWDIHSVCGSQVFKDKWKDATEEGCSFYKEVSGEQLKQKCNCKKHKEYREKVKTISYAIAYGATAYRISSVVGISVSEAQELIDDYFRAFPGIRKVLDGFSSYGIRNGFIMTAKPFNRRRYFDYWQGEDTQDYLLRRIGRASSNVPLQGSSGDQMKLAMCLMYWYIKDNNAWDKVRFIANIHDESVMHVREDFAEEWVGIMNDCMEEATTLTLPKGLLKADTGITGNMWTK